MSDAQARWNHAVNDGTAIVDFHKYMRLWRNWQTRYFEGVVFTRRVGSSPTDRTIGYPRAGSPTIIESRGRGGMADALASGASDGNIVEVQVLSTAP